MSQTQRDGIMNHMWIMWRVQGESKKSECKAIVEQYHGFESHGPQILITRRSHGWIRELVKWKFLRLIMRVTLPKFSLHYLSSCISDCLTITTTTFENPITPEKTYRQPLTSHGCEHITHTEVRQPQRSTHNSTRNKRLDDEIFYTKLDLKRLISYKIF